MAISGTEQPRSGIQSAGPLGGSSSRRGESGGFGDGIRQLVRDSTYRQIDNQKTRATETLGNLAGAVRGVTQQLNERGQSGLADYVNRAADGIDRWSSALRDRDVHDAVRELQLFARRRPAVFLGAAFGLGVVAARFFKSTSQPDENSGVRGSNEMWHRAGSMSAERPTVAHEQPTPPLSSFSAGDE